MVASTWLRVCAVHQANVPTSISYCLKDIGCTTSIARFCSIFQVSKHSINFCFFSFADMIPRKHSLRMLNWQILLFLVLMSSALWRLYLNSLLLSLPPRLNVFIEGVLHFTGCCWSRHWWNACNFCRRQSLQVTTQGC